MYDLIIVGGGPAGITAGIYAARRKLNTLLIAKDFGGQMARKTVAIENYPGFKEISGIQLIQNFVEHLKANKVEILQKSVLKIKKTDKNFLISTAGRKTLKALAVIIASGADPRPLEVPGEKKFIGKGVSYCTICDAPLFEQKNVAIIGGGNSGFESAIFMAKYALNVYILESAPEVKAEKELQQKAKESGKIKVMTSVAVKKINGNKFVESLVYQNLKAKEQKTLPVEGIFVEIGNIPATSFVKGLVDFNEKDEIKVNPFSGETSTPGLFAAGDADNVPYKQIVIGAGEGAKAALSAYAYIQKQQN